MAAATLQDAIDDVVINVVNNASTANFATWLEIFGSQVAAPLGRDTIDQRSVSNWLMPSLLLQSSFSNPVIPEDIQGMINNVFRILEATQVAEAAGRITAAQAQMVLDQYNIAWP